MRQVQLARANTVGRSQEPAAETLGNVVLGIADRVLRPKPQSVGREALQQPLGSAMAWNGVTELPGAHTCYLACALLQHLLEASAQPEPDRKSNHPFIANRQRLRAAAFSEFYQRREHAPSRKIQVFQRLMRRTNLMADREIHDLNLTPQRRAVAQDAVQQAVRVASCAG